MEIRVRMATAADIVAVHALYVAGGYGGGVHAGDTVIVAIVDDGVVGVVRLCAECRMRIWWDFTDRSDSRRCRMMRCLGS